MSRTEEYYQDEHGNWLPEAEEILAKATATQTTTELHDVKLRTTMNIELNTIELDILHYALHDLLRPMGLFLDLMKWTADAKQLETKLAEALKNSRIAAKATARTTV